MVETIDSVSVIGGGQLARMMTEPARRLGIKLTVLDATEDCPAAQLGAKQVLGEITDPNAIDRLAIRSQVLTWEIEHTDASHLQMMEQEGWRIEPSPATLAMIKDKLTQKEVLRSEGIRVPGFRAINQLTDIYEAGEQFGYPLVLKTRHNGYDGRGNAVIENQADIANTKDRFNGHKLYVEQFVPFKKELAVIGARGRSIDPESHGYVTYPVVETQHQDNICHTVIAPAPVDALVARRAEILAQQVMMLMQGRGVFAIEMFLDQDDQVLVNEIAPRVHNSGHFSIEGSQTSQFEQHLRAITELPLGPTEMTRPAAVMINILGDRTGKAQVQGLDEVTKIPETFIHLYGKDPRPQRKVGHITALGENVDEAFHRAKTAREYVKI